MYCTKCGIQVDDNAVKCPKCGSGSRKFSEYRPKFIYIEDQYHLKWYNMLVWVVLFVLAFASLSLGWVHVCTADRINAPLLLKIYISIIGVLEMAFSAYIIFVRSRLRGFHKSALANVIVMISLWIFFIANSAVIFRETLTRIDMPIFKLIINEVHIYIPELDAYLKTVLEAIHIYVTALEAIHIYVPNYFVESVLGFLISILFPSANGVFYIDLLYLICFVLKLFVSYVVIPGILVLNIIYFKKRKELFEF